MTPDEAPKLSPWPFIAVDALLLGSAFFIGYQSPAPLTGTPLIVAGGLVFAGAVVALIPCVLNYTRRQDADLRERQQEIAALAQSTAASAEQLSIAAASLHPIADTSAKAVKLAEQLPHKLQEKIHEFKEQLNEVTVTENEALSQEVNTLRAAETERMETLVTTVRKLSSEFARLEAASRKNVSELTDALQRFTTSAEQAAAEATTAIAAVRAGAEKSLASAHTAGTSAIETSLSHALAEIESKLGTLSGQLTAKVQHATDLLDSRIAKLESLASRPDAEPPRMRRKAAAPESERMETRSASAQGEPVEAVSAPVSDAPVSHTPSEAAISEARDMAPHAAATADAVPASAAAPAMATATASVVELPAGDAAKSARKARAAKRNGSDNELTLGLELPASDNEYSQVGPDGESTSAVSADGFTRLVVTSYIGIGNKLFVRGQAPGLSSEKGVPLQFVSIGKWRWESPEVTEPVRVKLYKNDEIECTALGEIVLEPGHQREVSASF